MADRPGVAAAMAAALVTAVTAGCATSAPASLAPSSEPARSAPTAVLTPGDPDCRVDTPAPGFPTDLLPVPPGAEQLLSCASAADPTSEIWDVSLSVRSAADVPALLDAVRQPLLAAGFAEQSETPADGVAAQSVFSRSDGELVIMAILDDGTVRTLSVGGSVMIQAPDGNG